MDQQRNVENCEKLARVIEDLELSNLQDNSGFCMTGHQHYCGTPSCISGWAAHICLGTKAKGFEGDIDEVSADFLGIELNRAGTHELFYPSVSDPWDKITPTQAAKVLRHLAATGETDWTVAGLTRYESEKGRG